MLSRRIVWKWVASVVPLMVAFAVVTAPGRGDEPSRLGRLFRFASGLVISVYKSYSARSFQFFWAAAGGACA